MNAGLVVLVIVAAWAVLATVVALAVGAMARARDVVLPEPPTRRTVDEGVRAAM